MLDCASLGSTLSLRALARLGSTLSVFGLARLADALMDAWMADPALNANTKVAKWHESQQKYGFKFLVTQIMGYLTGGPQRYTGRPMDEAHKHLAISSDQWTAFMTDASTVFRRFNLDDATKLELCGILSTYRSACVLGPNEAIPEDPGLLRPKGNGSTLYQRLGGVYPIAQFVDTLVDKVLAGDRVHVESDRIEDLAGKRHPPGLKYMLTELVCSSTGGPEVVTSKGFDEAKLGVQPQEWPAFLQLASEAAELWPIAHLRNGLVAALGTVKAEICIGIFEEETTLEAKARRMVQEAGFDHYLASAALEKTEGDPAKALELLARGWTPSDGDAMSLPGSVASLSSLGGGGWDPDAPRCPFGGAGTGAALPPFHPPIHGVPKTASPADEQRTTAVKALADQGMASAQIAALLSMHETEVEAMISGGAGPVRVLGNERQMRLDKLLEEDAELCCPVSLVLYVDPVIASDGFMYEKASVQGLLRNRMVSPMTRESLKPEFVAAKQKRSAALEYRQMRSEELLVFATETADTQRAMATQALQRATDYIEVLRAEQVPSLAGHAAALWRRLGQPTPTALQGC